MHILNTIILRLILINGHFKDHWVGCFPSTLPSELKKLKTGAKHLKEWLVGELERRTQGNERGYGGYQKERGWNSESKGIQEKIKLPRILDISHFYLYITTVLSFIKRTENLSQKHSVYL